MDTVCATEFGRPFSCNIIRDGRVIGHCAAYWRAGRHVLHARHGAVAGHTARYERIGKPGEVFTKKQIDDWIRELGEK